MMRGDDVLQANRLFSAKTGLGRGRLVLAIKALLFFMIAKSYPLLWNNRIDGARQWFQIWDQWDFGYYQKIAEFGYSRNDGSIAFYPLFSWLMALVTYISRSYLAAGLIISGIASIIAVIVFAKTCPA
jgi:hypothetical protein